MYREGKFKQKTRKGLKDHENYDKNIDWKDIRYLKLFK